MINTILCSYIEFIVRIHVNVQINQVMIEKGMQWYIFNKYLFFIENLLMNIHIFTRILIVIL